MPRSSVFRGFPIGWAGTTLSGVLLCTLLICGCRNPTQPPTPLGVSFDLSPGSSTKMSNGLTLTFNAVTEDSRCPIGVFCIVAGDATVMVTLSQHGADSLRELHTNRDPSEVGFSSSVVKLLSLAPLPTADHPVAAKDYVATFRVDPLTP